MEDVLIICVGNTARGDDGVAHEVARLLEEGGRTVVRATSLDVTHAPDVAGARHLIVVDAVRRPEPAVEIVALSAGRQETGTHGLSPRALLGLARDLYGASPPAHLVGVAAHEMEHGEGLSAHAQKAARQAAFEIESLLDGRPTGGAAGEPGDEFGL